MPSVRVERYVIRLGAFKGTTAVTPYHFVVLQAETGQAIDAVYLLFLGGPYLGNTFTPRRVYAYLPPHELEKYVDVLRSEDPVYVEWNVDAAGELTTVWLRTDDEPVGEGPVDTF
jgi:hypothetical protein